MSKDNIIKSAWEIALENASKIETSDEDIRMAQYEETGKRIAGRYLSDTAFDLQNELTKYKGKELEEIAKNIISVLIHNIVLSKNKTSEEDARRVLKE